MRYRLDQIYLNDVVLYEDEDGKKRVGRIIASGGQVVEFAEEAFNIGVGSHG